MQHWAKYLVLGGIVVNLIDGLTTKAGDTGGVLYGPTGMLNAVNKMLPAGVRPGDAIAATGLILMHV